MAAKFDKEMLIKHHFWVLLGVLVPVMIVALVGLWASAASEIEARHEAVKAAESALGSANAKGIGLLNGYQGQQEVLGDKRGKMWKEAWDYQSKVFSRLPANKFPVLAKATFGDKLPIPELEEIQVSTSGYQQLYDKAARSVRPTRFGGASGTWRDTLRWVPSWPLQPDSEEVWLALEDLWVQAEILKVIAEVNNSIGRFEIVGDQSDVKNRTFRSRLWEVTLKLDDTGRDRVITGTIKNVTERRLKLGLNNTMILKIFLTEDERVWIDFPVEGDSVAAGDTLPIKPVARHTLDPDIKVNGLFKVAQQFDLLTVPVKQINNVALYYPSARTVAKQPLLMTDFSEEAAGDTAAPGAGSPGFGSPMGGDGSGPASLDGGFGGGGPGAGQAAAKVTKNGLVQQRYIAKTAQVRRMPIALSLVVDQADTHDRLVAFSNSQMRFQNTQFHWKRLPIDLIAFASDNSPTSPDGGDDGEGSGDGGEGSGDGGDEGSGGLGLGGFGAPPGFGGPPRGFGPGRGSGTLNATGAPERNLVEFAVYGTASLYYEYVPEAGGASTP